MIDEATLIAWLDGELDATRAAEVEAAVMADAELAELADRHRTIKARFALAFGPIAETPVAMPGPTPATILSFADARAERDARRKAEKTPAKAPRWAIPAAIAASILAGILFLQPSLPLGASGGIGDKANALALSAPIAEALDGQLSGKVGAVRVALSFRGKDGHYCRSFAATHLAGIACRGDAGWQLRYASVAPPSPDSDYRQAGDDSDQAAMVASMIAGEPLDEAGERRARDAGWK